MPPFFLRLLCDSFNPCQDKINYLCFNKYFGCAIMPNHTLIKSCLIIAFLAETFCVRYALKFPAWVPAASVIYCVSGVLIAIFFYACQPVHFLFLFSPLIHLK